MWAGLPSRSQVLRGSRGALGPGKLGPGATPRDPGLGEVTQRPPAQGCLSEWLSGLIEVMV